MRRRLPSGNTDRRLATSVLHSQSRADVAASNPKPAYKQLYSSLPRPEADTESLANSTTSVPVGTARSAPQHTTSVRRPSFCIALAQPGGDVGRIPVELRGDN